MAESARASVLDAQLALVDALRTAVERGDDATARRLHRSLGALLDDEPQHGRRSTRSEPRQPAAALLDWDARIDDWLQEQLQTPCVERLGCPCARCAGITTAQVLAGAIGISPGKQGRAHQMRAAAPLHRAGWQKTQVHRLGVRSHRFFPPKR